MSHPFDEGNQHFEFDSKWKVERYDGGGDTPVGGHTFYRNQVSHLPNTKAVDFVGVHALEGAFLIEVKDFRGFRIQNKKRLKSGELALEVAHKVRDTVAGLVGAVRNETHASALTDVGLSLLKQTETVRIVLWLEDDAAANGRVWAEELNTLMTRIQGYLRWLTPRVLVVSGSTYAQKLPGLQVTNVPRKPASSN